jgi:hypothetical protein
LKLHTDLPEPAMTPVRSRCWRALPWLGALFAFWLAAAASAQEIDPPGRVANLSFRQGSVVFAPQGEQDWGELPANRPLTSGDRLWSDQDARAELQLGSATLHLDGQSHLGLSDLDDRSAQFILQQGTVNARVRELLQGENFEIGTPNIAFRALQPGDYRIDVDPGTQQTRVVVHSGLAAIFGEGGQSIQMGAGQQATFAGRFLAQAQGPGWRPQAFDAWAAERNRMEDQSLAARHVPRGVVGYAQLDPYGTWSQDPGHGAVWYPRVAVADWAPYRYGHWDWISPWGWTWIDDAPWGFAPFHYGRWTMIGQRWAWVPGRMVARPAYAPALVVFMGSGSQFSFSVGSGPGVGWYPLAPGEAWWPTYRTSPRYVGFVNYSINLHNYPRNYDHHVWRQRPFAATAVSEDDFRRGRPVYRHWQPVSPQAIGRVQVGVVPGSPQTRQPREATNGPRLLSQPPASVQPGGAPQRFWSGRAQAPAVQEQFRAQREQDRLQHDAERGAREQVRQQEQQRHPQDPRTPRENFQQRQPQDQRAQQEAWQRRQQEQAIRQQQDQRAQREAGQQRPQQEQVQRQQEQAQRQQQEQAQRQQQQVQRQQEQIQRQQQHAQRQREQARREGWQREREPQGLQRVPQQAVQEVVRQQQQQQQPQLQQPQGPRGPEGRGEGRGHREGGGEGRGRGSRD